MPVLPELPLPSALPSASGSGSSLLFHPRVSDEAHRVLHQPDPELARRLAAALANTATDYIELVDQVPARNIDDDNDIMMITIIIMIIMTQ